MYLKNTVQILLKKKKWYKVVIWHYYQCHWLLWNPLCLILVVFVTIWRHLFTASLAPALTLFLPCQCVCTCRKLQVISWPWQDLDLSRVRLTVADPFCSTCRAWVRVSVDHEPLLTSVCSPVWPVESGRLAVGLRSPLLLEDLSECAAMVL